MITLSSFSFTANDTDAVFSGYLHDVLSTDMCICKNDGEITGPTAQYGPVVSCGFIASDCHNIQNLIETIV
jgi:hypothetical protein